MDACIDQVVKSFRALEMHSHSKAGLFEATICERSILKQKIGRLSPAELVYHGSMGEWSVKDILQHLVDWEQRWMGRYEAGKGGETVVTPEVRYTCLQMGQLNERYRHTHKDRPLEQVLGDLHASCGR